MNSVDLHLFNVGHGLSALVRIHESASPRNVLIDGGPKNARVVERLQRICPGEPLDLVILSHIHSDHCTGLIDVVREWPAPIRRLWIPYPTRDLQSMATALNGGPDISPTLRERRPARNREVPDLISIAEERVRTRYPDWREHSSSGMGRDECHDERHHHVYRELCRALSRLGPPEDDEAYLLLEECLSRAVHEDPVDCMRLAHCLRHSFRAHRNIAPAFLLAATACFAAADQAPNAQRIIREMESFITRADQPILSFAFQKAMSTYRRLNELLTHARARQTPVPIVHMTTPLQTPSGDAAVQVLAPTYDLIAEVEATCRQTGWPFAEELLYKAVMAAANVIGGVVRIQLPGTSILFPGDSDLQDIDDRQLACDVVICPHHGGHASDVPRRLLGAMRPTGNARDEQRVLLISKAADDRPTEEWVRHIRAARTWLDVYCTSGSTRDDCRGCTQGQDDEIHMRLENGLWIPRQPAAECRLVEGEEHA